jgi:Ca-activated chloride channel homolog
MNLFALPEWLLLGLLATTAVGIFLFWSERRKTRRLKKFAANKLLQKLAESHSRPKIIARNIIYTAAILLLFLALAKPQWGKSKRKAIPTGIDVLIALDVSRSMLARDVRPNRIERVKLGISNLLEKVKGDRLGLIAFAGNSFLQCPLTLDHSAFRRTLREMKVGVIKNQGTDLSRPIDEAARSFSEDDSDRFLILISDGEDLEGEGLKKAKESAKEGVQIYTIGIGSQEGARIPLDPIPQKPRNFLRNPAGKAVVTKLDDTSLRAIAESTGGKYFQLGPTGEGLARVFDELQAIGHRKRHAILSQELPIDRYQPFVALAMLMLATEFMLGNRRRIRAVAPSLALMMLIFITGCFRNDNVKRAEAAHKNQEFEKAAAYYEAEINATKSENKQVDPRLYLNAGLAHLDASNLEKSETFLEKALDGTVDEPSLQSTILNTLGNLEYNRANEALDRIDVKSARKAWEKALRHYESAMSIDDNPKANVNRDELAKQIENRIKSMLSLVSGIVWRDVDGDGRSQEKEPRLPSKIYWDQDNDGEHNASSEPFVETDEKGQYAIEWISAIYPTSFQLGCVPAESNGTKGVTLLPLLVPPPPPFNPNNVRTQFVELEKTGDRQVHFPYRAAPMLRGFVWNDANRDGARDDNESGFSEATLFLDLDGNLALDENETSFKPSESGEFSQVVPPGQHVLCIQIEGEDANVTFPVNDEKAHLASVDFETAAKHLDFGVSTPQEGQGESQKDTESDPKDSDSEPSPQDTEDGEDETATSRPEVPQEVNALYERLLQEIEANSEPLDIEGKIVETPRRGRDY